MKLLFKQRLFSWMDSYDIFDDAGQTVYTVKGVFGFGHRLRIFNAAGVEEGIVKEKVISWLPKFEIYRNELLVGTIHREFTFFKPRYNIDFNGWKVTGNWTEWDYTVLNAYGQTVATVSKQIWKLTDTYVLDVVNLQDAIYVLMLVLAIDAEKCTRGS